MPRDKGHGQIESRHTPHRPGHRLRSVRRGRDLEATSSVTDDKGPFFNLKAVVQQTGLKPDTLRAWERRYGLPSPRRSAGRHRLYSQKDIDTVKWLMERQREGMTISRAVELWQQTEAEGRDPLHTPAPLASPALPAVAPARSGETISQLRKDWINSCLMYREQQAEQILAQAFALFPPEVVALDLIQRAVAEIGEGWYRGEVTVQQEHFCSALAMRRLEALIMAAPVPTRAGRILAGCPPHEHHVIGLLLLSLLLRRRGWDVVYLGADVPADRLEMTIELAHPQLVILSAQRLHTAATLVDIAQVLEPFGIPLAYGGLIFNRLPALRDRVPGHFLGDRLDVVPEKVDRLLAAPRTAAPASIAIPDRYRLARAHYQERLGLIEVSVSREMRSMGLISAYLPQSNRELALNVGAALALGNLEFLGTDLEWVEGLMQSREMPRALLADYLEAYYRAARTHLDEPGEPILTWLGNLIRKQAVGAS